MSTRPVSKHHREPDGPTRWRCDEHGEFYGGCAPECPVCTGGEGTMVQTVELVESEPPSVRRSA